MNSVAIIGAGIAGVSAAYHLAAERGAEKVAIVDPRPPLSLTSDKSTECYRNWWPNRPMVELMNHSIDLLEGMAIQSGNVFGLNRRGYLFVTEDEAKLATLRRNAEAASSLGAGPFRTHPGSQPYRPHDSDGWENCPTGADLLDRETLRENFPYLTESAIGAVHVRRAGWFSAQQLGAWMLDRAKDAGTTHLMRQVVGVEETASGYRLALDDGTSLEAEQIVIAAGPLSPKVASMVGLDLPVFSELHLKVGFREHLGRVPRNAPMIIWSDTQTIEWSDEERAGLAELGRHDLLREMPIFCHGRPEGGEDSPYLLALWEYHGGQVEPTWPIPTDDLYPEVVMRGLSTMVPGLASYLDGLPAHDVDGGYYSKTRENRPLIGPAGPPGVHLMAAMSGFGVMVAAGAGDLAARHVTGEDLPDHASSFLLSRYEDPAYLAEIEAGAESGQL